jgi:hypothetical protein
MVRPERIEGTPAMADKPKGGAAKPGSTTKKK